MELNEPLLGHISSCQICSNEKLEKILSLGHHPPVHAHLTEKMLHEPEVSYPLNLCFCENCGLVQIDYAVDPKTLFYHDYPYHTGMTNMLVRNFRSLADMVFNRYGLNNNDLVIDIGSNDGTLLKGFQEKGIRVLGVEPTKVSQVAIANGIPTIQEFFNENVARDIVNNFGVAKVVTATNMFAHINNLFEFLRGIEILLDKDGVFVSESQYLMDVIEKLEVDTIYHEHLRYYSLKPLIQLFSQVGFSLVDALRIDAAGGSIRVFAMKGERPPSDNVDKIIEEEKRKGLHTIEPLRDFARRALNAKHSLVGLIVECKKAGGRIVGLGAPGRSNTLLGFTKINYHLLDYACERALSPKIGLYAPGSHIPIVDEERLFVDQPEYALLLSWHIGDELMRKIRGVGFKGKFIMPLPNPRIVEEI